MGLLDDLANAEGSVGDYARQTIADPPRPFEAPRDTAARQLDTQLRQERVQRIRGADFAAQGIPTTTDQTGTVQPIRDESGVPLTKFNKRSSVAWDSMGQPKAIVAQPDGTVATQDPYEGVPVTRDKKTASQYQVRPGLPWKYLGPDDEYAAQKATADKEKAIAQAASAAGAKLSLDHHTALTADLDLKKSRKELDALTGKHGLSAADPNGQALQASLDSLDPDTARKAVDDHFNILYASPAANVTKSLFSNELSPAAQELRKQIDTDKAEVHRTVDRVLNIKARADGARAREAATRQVAEPLQQQNVSNRLRAAGILGLDTLSEPTEPAPTSSAPVTEPVAAEQPVDDWAGEPAQGAVQAAPFTPEEQPFRIDEAGDVTFDPARLTAGITAAAQTGHIDADKAAKLLPLAQAAEKAYQEQAKLLANDSVASKLKALGVGATKGAAFLAGAPAGAALGAEAGTLVTPGIGTTIGGALGGLISGSVAAWGAGSLIKKLGQYSDTIQSFQDAADAHPYYDAAGNLVAFGAGIPKAGFKAIGSVIGGAERTASVGTRIADEAAAAKAAGTAQTLNRSAAASEVLSPANLRQAVAQGYENAGGGVASTIGNLTEEARRRALGGASPAEVAKVVAARVGGNAAGMVLIDTAIKEGSKALGLSDEGQTLPGAAQAALLGAFFAGHGIKFADTSSAEMADILSRAKARLDAGVTLDAKLEAGQMKPGTDIHTAEALSKPLTPREMILASQFEDEVQRLVNTGQIKMPQTVQDQLTLAQGATGKEVLQGGRRIAGGVEIKTPGEAGPSGAIPSAGSGPAPQLPSSAGQPESISGSEPVRQPAEPGPLATSEPAQPSLQHFGEKSTIPSSSVLAKPHPGQRQDEPSSGETATNSAPNLLTPETGSGPVERMPHAQAVQFYGSEARANQLMPESGFVRQGDEWVKSERKSETQPAPELTPEQLKNTDEDAFRNTDDDHYEGEYVPGDPKFDSAVSEVRSFLGGTKNQAAFILKSKPEEIKSSVAMVVTNGHTAQPAESEGHKKAFAEMLDQAHDFVRSVQDKWFTKVPEQAAEVAPEIELAARQKELAATDPGDKFVRPLIEGRIRSLEAMIAQEQEIAAAQQERATSQPTVPAASDSTGQPAPESPSTSTQSSVPGVEALQPSSGEGQSAAPSSPSAIPGASELPDATSGSVIAPERPSPKSTRKTAAPAASQESGAARASENQTPTREQSKASGKPPNPKLQQLFMDATGARISVAAVQHLMEFSRGGLSDSDAVRATVNVFNQSPVKAAHVSLDESKLEPATASTQPSAVPGAAELESSSQISDKAKADVQSQQTGALTQAPAPAAAETLQPRQVGESSSTESAPVAAKGQGSTIPGAGELEPSKSNEPTQAPEEKPAPAKAEAEPNEPGGVKDAGGSPAGGYEGEPGQRNGEVDAARPGEAEAVTKKNTETGKKYSAGALRFHNAELTRLEPTGVTVEFAKDDGDTAGLKLNISTLQISLDAEKIGHFADVVQKKGMNGQTWVRASIGEEIIHSSDAIASSLFAKPGEAPRLAFSRIHNEIANDVGADALAEVSKIHGGADTPVVQAAEYMRMLVQNRRGELITEATSGENTVAMLKYLEADQPESVERLYEAMESVVAAPSDRLMNEGEELSPQQFRAKVSEAIERVSRDRNAGRDIAASSAALKAMEERWTAFKDANPKAFAEWKRDFDAVAALKPGDRVTLPDGSQATVEKANRTSIKVSGHEKPVPMTALRPVAAGSAEPRITGPALRDQSGAIVARGKIGQTHSDLIMEAAKRGEDVTDAEHVFLDTQGNALNRTEAAKVADAAGQRKGTGPLHSQQLFAGKPEHLSIPFDIESKYMGGNERDSRSMVPGVWMDRSGRIIPIDTTHEEAAKSLLKVEDGENPMQAAYAKGWVRVTIRNFDPKAVAITGPKPSPSQLRNLNDWTANHGYSLENYTNRYVRGELYASKPLASEKDYEAIADKIDADKPTLAAPITHGAALRSEYGNLASRTGYPFVSIADLAEKVGFAPGGDPMARAKGTLVSLMKDGKAQLGTGDWSLATPRERAWAVVAHGERYLFADLRKQSEVPGARELTASKPNPLVASIKAKLTNGTLTPQELDDLGPVLKRDLRDLYRGVSDKLVDNEKTKALGQAMKREVDREQEILGKTQIEIDRMEKRIGRKALKRAAFEVQGYRKKQDSDPAAAATMLPKLSADAQKLVAIQNEVYDRIATLSEKLGMQVQQEDGSWRKFKRRTDYVPRIRDRELMNAIANPTGNPKAWRKAVEIYKLWSLEHERANPGVTPVKGDHGLMYINGVPVLKNNADVVNYTKGTLGPVAPLSGTARNSNLLHSRTAPQPTQIYDYSFDAFERYRTAAARTLAQVEAYGQTTSETDLDLWDKTIQSSGDASTREYLGRVRDAVYGVTQQDTTTRMMAFLSSIATGTQLTNPVTTMANLLGGISDTAHMHGLGNTLAALKNLRQLAGLIDSAKEKGIIMRNLRGLGHDEENHASNLLDKTRELAGKGLELAGYNAVEEFNRSIAMAAGQIHLGKLLETIRRNPGARAAQEAEAFIRKTGVDFDKIKAENGAGRETDRFLRKTTNESQGSYKLAQTPLFTNTPIGRFLLQYQKWGVQHTQFFMDRLVKPAKDFIGSGGKKGSMVPLLRYVLLTALGGMGLIALKDALFGTANPSASFEEIEKTASEDEKRAFVLLAQKLWKAQMAVSFGGIFSNYAQMVGDVFDRSRVKSFLSPPGVSSLTGASDTLLRLLEQKKLTLGDLDDFLRSQLSAYRVGKAGVARLADEVGAPILKNERSRQDLSWLNAQTRRFADEVGIEASHTALGRISKTSDSPAKTDLLNALRTGDDASAKEALGKLLHGDDAAAKKRALESVRATVRASQPVKVGAASETRRELFNSWAAKRLPAEDVARLHKIDSTYRDTAQRIGLFRESPVTPKALNAAREKHGMN